MTRPETIDIYDTTLRDGTQGVGISLSLEDKLDIARRLDAFGVTYIEGGWPGSNPKDAAFFARARNMPWGHARLAAFGSTRRLDGRVEDDPNVAALLDAGTPVCTIVGKACSMQVAQVLRGSERNNLLAIGDTVMHLLAHGREVVFDAEHFFDGFGHDPEYALATLRAAATAGATTLVLCDTNGGSLPHQIASIVREVARRVPGVRLGFHGHNDSGCAVANSLAAVIAGASHVQGTINGYGERCGNADLCAVIPGLELKLGRHCVPEGQMAELTELSRYVAERVNMAPDPRAPYVGRHAFVHKGGLHAAATRHCASAYLHCDPAQVGNETDTVVSDLAGRGNVQSKLESLGLPSVDVERTRAIVEAIKHNEAEGVSYEAADASVAVLAARHGADYVQPFALRTYAVTVDHDSGTGSAARARVHLELRGRSIEGTATGLGPVHALDQALRQALAPHFPVLHAVRLVDYKVRVLDPGRATAAKTRVLVESSDGVDRWGTVGASTNILDASYQALADAIEYVLLRHGTARLQRGITA